MYLRDQAALAYCTLSASRSRFRVHSVSPSTALHLHSEHLSNFSACSVSTSATSAHALWAPQRLPRMLCACGSSFRTLSERVKVFGKFRGQLWCVLSMHRNCCSILTVGTSRFRIHSVRASAPSAHAQCTWKLINFPNIGQIKKMYSKKHQFIHRQLQFRENSKIGNNKILILVYI